MPGNIVIKSTNNNIFHNLAFEEYAMDNLTGEYKILFLWQSIGSIVIGRYQNPFKECDVGSIQKQNIQLGRRISGGGTVYQDLGNLNFSFISRKKFFNKDENFSVITDTLSKWKIYSHISPNNDILVFGKKVSGNAFCHKRNSSLHHGTLLIESDLCKLEDVLKKPEYEIIDNSVSSKKSITANLKSFNTGINIFNLEEEIIKEYNKYCRAFNDYDLIDENVFPEYHRKMKSSKWIFGFPEIFSVLNKLNPCPKENTIKPNIYNITKSTSRKSALSSQHKELPDFL
ncbi:MAG: lipoate--protein ligase family protein [Bacteroidetes bacterium]|nr:lipoate--protein ligase family protein [Bacteroidota bacterium]